MASLSEPAGLRAAMALSYVCRHLDELTELLGEDRAPLQELLTAVCPAPVDEPELTALLDALHTAVQSAGDPQGVYGDAGRNLALAGVDSLEIVYRCPRRLCTGRSRDEIAESIPVCRLDPNRAALLRERLP